MLTSCSAVVAPNLDAASTSCCASARLFPNEHNIAIASCISFVRATSACLAMGKSIAEASTTTFSLSSRTMRSAVFLPKPLIWVSCLVSPLKMATARALQSIPDKIACATLHPMPEMEISRKTCFFLFGSKAEKGKSVFFNLQVGVQTASLPHLTFFLRERGNAQFVTYSANVQNHSVFACLRNFSADVTVHNFSVT